MSRIRSPDGWTIETDETDTAQSLTKTAQLLAESVASILATLTQHREVLETLAKHQAQMWGIDNDPFTHHIKEPPTWPRE